MLANGFLPNTVRSAFQMDAIKFNFVRISVIWFQSNGNFETLLMPKYIYQEGFIVSVLN
jgi:hypothetical protein